MIISIRVEPVQDLYHTWGITETVILDPQITIQCDSKDGVRRRNPLEDEIDLSVWAVRIFVGGLIVGAIILTWLYVLGPLFNQADYSIFNSSPQHVNAVAQKFSDDCQQLALTSDPNAVKAIEQDIYQEASTIDLKSVQMSDKTRSCVNQAIQDRGE